MSKKADPIGGEKRGRGRPRKSLENQVVCSEQAAAYGISVPALTSTGGRFLSPNDIGKIMNVTGEAVKQWIYRRKLPAVKLANGYWKISVADFEAFLKARTEIGQRHILVTDGADSGSSEVIKAIEGLGHQPVLADNYSDALLKALDHLPSLFVICVGVNDSECWKFAEKIRSHKSLRSFPILLIAGTKISGQDSDNAVKCYAQGILSRPLNVEIVKNEIERILRRA